MELKLGKKLEKRIEQAVRSQNILLQRTRKTTQPFTVDGWVKECLERAVKNIENRVRCLEEDEGCEKPEWVVCGEDQFGNRGIFLRKG